MSGAEVSRRSCLDVTVALVQIFHRLIRNFMLQARDAIDFTGLANRYACDREAIQLGRAAAAKVDLKAYDIAVWETEVARNRMFEA